MQVAKRELSMECDYNNEAKAQERFHGLISCLSNPCNLINLMSAILRADTTQACFCDAGGQAGAVHGVRLQQ